MPPAIRTIYNRVSVLLLPDASAQAELHTFAHGFCVRLPYRSRLQALLRDQYQARCPKGSALCIVATHARCQRSTILHSLLPGSPATHGSLSRASELSKPCRALMGSAASVLQTAGNTSTCRFLLQDNRSISEKLLVFAGSIGRGLSCLPFTQSSQQVRLPFQQSEPPNSPELPEQHFSQTSKSIFLDLSGILPVDIPAREIWYTT